MLPVCLNRKTQYARFAYVLVDQHDTATLCNLTVPVALNHTVRAPL